MLSIGDAINISNNASSTLKASSNTLVQLKANLAKEQKTLYELIGSGASAATITTQNDLVSSIATNINNQSAYINLVSASQSNAKNILNQSAGITGTSSTANPFGGPTGPRGPVGATGASGVTGPRGSAGPTVIFDSMPTSGSSNLVTSNGVFNAIQSLTSVSATYSSPIVFPTTSTTGQLLTDGTYLYYCSAGGTPGTWMRTAPMT